MFQVYTDGACHTPTRKGGWAALVIGEGKRVPLQGAEENTTSNRMELVAALHGIEATPEGAQVSLYSDSQYLVKTMTGRQKRIKNLDLWQRLDELSRRRQVAWQWVRAHHNHPENEEVNRMAQAMLGLSPQMRMVDISEKPITERRAIARGVVRMSTAALERIRSGQVAKGDVLQAAPLAAMLAAKRTADLLPFCHPLLIENIQVDCHPREEDNGVEITAAVAGRGRTGFEMEALTAVAIGALTIYDMCKAYDPAMAIEIRLIRKSGGQSGTVELSQ